jgi:hypothetical protein
LGFNPERAVIFYFPRKNQVTEGDVESFFCVHNWSLLGGLVPSNGM